MLHRAVMSVVLGRQLGRDEFVCHRDDDRRNNWPQNLYLGDYPSNAADSLRNGGRVRGDSTRSRSCRTNRSVRSGEPWPEGSGVVILPEPVGCIGARSAGSSTACVASRASHAEHDRRVVPPGPIATDLSLRSFIAPRSVSPIQSTAVPPLGFLNTDWRSGFADSNP